MSSSAHLAVVARARGLGAHLFAAAERRDLAASPTVPTLISALLQRDGTFVAPANLDAGGVEAMLRRRLNDMLRRLERFGAGRQVPALAAFFVHEDRRSLRALLRGAAAGAPPEARLDGLMSTPRLPARLLQRLADATTAQEALAELIVAGDAEATRLLDAARGLQPDLFALDLAIDQSWARCLDRASRRGDRTLRQDCAEHLDLANVTLWLAAASASRPPGPTAQIAPGRPTFLAAMAENTVNPPNPAAALAVLKEQVTTLSSTRRSTSLVVRAIEAAADWTDLEPQFSRLRLKGLLDLARREPLGSAPILAFLAAARRESSDIGRIAWGLGLGAVAAAPSDDDHTGAAT